jgi:hypothetical protein
MLGLIDNVNRVYGSNKPEIEIENSVVVYVLQ